MTLGSRWASEQVCDECWGRRSDGRQPYRMKPEFRERTPCYLCGRRTESGIYLRVEVVELPE